VVTVLFSDITGSTSLGESLDPESLQQMLSHYFAEMKVVVERHGGTVSKFIGDAVMAIFGLPRTHEDDALRAVRAAAEMRDVLAQLNTEFVAKWGVTLAIRTGVNTGEVLAREPSDGQALVVGDPVNTAARLEQMAEPGEILIGRDTYWLVHDAVTAESLGPLELRGKVAAVPAWRLIGVIVGAPGWNRRADSPLVGREHQIARLEDTFARVVGAGTCELVTVMAPAGVGKSRLIAEMLSRFGPHAMVLEGRCLPYGDGITFWPIASILMEAIGITERDSETEARDRLSGVLAQTTDDPAEDALVCDALAPLLGFGTEAVGIRETFWAVRTLLERLAARRPVVAVFDDIHWGEPTFLDLVEYLGDWIRDAPVLLVCQARPELLDVRPGWPSAKENASLLTLPPLSDEQTETLLRGLMEGAELPVEARTRIATLAEGNPLFVEETVRMLIDRDILKSRDGQWIVAGDLSAIAIPPTIHALLTARLDRLEPEQRMVAERASIVGRSFWWGAVLDLASAEVQPRVGECLQSLVRKGLITPDRSEIRGEDAFRFTHILIRDAAYQGIPKATRAEMHERLADWIAATTRDLPGKYEEIVGYHLEMAHRSLLELGPPNDRTSTLAHKATQTLSSAGERALARSDMPAAVNLLSRAIALLSPREGRRLELLTEIAFALIDTGDFDRLVDVADEISAAAREAKDVGLQANATIVGLWIRLFTNPESWTDDATREAGRAITTFRELGNDAGLARAWSLLGLTHMMSAQFAEAEDSWSKAVEHAQRAGSRRDALEGLSWIPGAVWAGPMPADEGIRRCQSVIDQARGDKKAVASAMFSQGFLEACLGRFDDAHVLFAQARNLLEDVALPVWIAGPLTQCIGWAELLAGNAPAAESKLREGCDTLAAIGEVTLLSTVAAMLAEAIYAQERYDETDRFIQLSEESAGPEDVYTHALWRTVRAKVIARRGEVAKALELGQEAIDLAESSDSLHLQWYVLMGYAEVLGAADRTSEAVATLRHARRLAEQKGNLVAARLGQESLDRLVG
jgi:class 3 adenylate cyclase/tetratricopeptide (TPR) repeat protein